MFAQTIKQLLATAQPGDHIEISGWVRNRSKRPSFTFLNLNDGSSLQGLQIIVDNTIEDYENTIRQIQMGTSVRVAGNVVARCLRHGTTWPGQLVIISTGLNV